jgi:hypothetical protein
MLQQQLDASTVGQLAHMPGLAAGPLNERGWRHSGL